MWGYTHMKGRHVTSTIVQLYSNIKLYSMYGGRVWLTPGLASSKHYEKNSCTRLKENIRLCGRAFHFVQIQPRTFIGWRKLAMSFSHYYMEASEISSSKHKTVSMHMDKYLLFQMLISNPDWNMELFHIFHNELVFIYTYVHLAFGNGYEVKLKITKLAQSINCFPSL